MRIDIVKYEEGFLIVVKILKRAGGCPMLLSLQKLDRKRLQLNRQCNSSSTSLKWRKGQMRKFSRVFGTGGT